ncbi:HNH endonuclease signature motif containing protein [Bradyrhizobium sp. UFLA05-153]
MSRLGLIGSRVPLVSQRLPKAPKIADEELLTPEHRAWRKAVLDRAGWQCEWIDDGSRCSKSASNGDVMYADHRVERADGGANYDIDNGRCLCAVHHGRKTRDERNKRLARRY